MVLMNSAFQGCLLVIEMGRVNLLQITHIFGLLISLKICHIELMQWVFHIKKMFS